MGRGDERPGVPGGGPWENISPQVDHDLTRQQALTGACHSQIEAPEPRSKEPLVSKVLRPMYLFFLALNCTILR
jgi:hypothetical protein